MWSIFKFHNQTIEIQAKLIKRLEEKIDLLKDLIEVKNQIIEIKDLRIKDQKEFNDKLQDLLEQSGDQTNRAIGKAKEASNGVETLKNTTMKDLTYKEKMELHTNEIKFIENMYGITEMDFETALTPLHYLDAMAKYAQQLRKIN